MDPNQIYLYVAYLIALLIGFTVHEFAHAWTADQLGDDTPRQYGRLTLDPRAHLDPIGSIMLLVGGFGWARPVPINPYALGRRSPLGVMLVSLAGPFSNFLMAVLAAIPLRIAMANSGVLGFMLDQPFLFNLIFDLMYINLGLMLFNLIPIAPLDGSKIAVSILPESWGRVIEQTEAYGPYVLMALMVISRTGFSPIGWLINPVIENLTTLLIGWSF